jgi:hypothetical protein
MRTKLKIIVLLEIKQVKNYYYLNSNHFNFHLFITRHSSYDQKNLLLREINYYLLIHVQ